MNPHPTFKAFALGLFRTSVFFFVAIAAFTETDPKTRSILVTLVFLIDVATWHLCMVVGISADVIYSNGWRDTLADRFFFEKVLDHVRDGSHIDAEYIRQESIKDAGADIKKYLEDETLWFRWGGLKKTLMGLAYFTWYWISYGIFYGIAGIIGSSLRPTWF